MAQIGRRTMVPRAYRLFLLVILLAFLLPLGMLLRETGTNKSDAKLVDAGNRVEQAVMSVTPKMKSQNAGRMGFSTTQVGDLVAEAVTAG